MKIKAYYVSEPEAEPETLPDDRPLLLADDYVFYVNDKPYWIPKGYSIDGASIPRPFWPFIGSPFEPDFWAGAFAHDSIYLAHGLDRTTADEILYQLLLQSGVSSFRAHIIWGAVRTCAGFAWKNTQADSKALEATRQIIRERSDRDKFMSLWFA